MNTHIKEILSRVLELEGLVRVAAKQENEVIIYELLKDKVAELNCTIGEYCDNALQNIDFDDDEDVSIVSDDEAIVEMETIEYSTETDRHEDNTEVPEAEEIVIQEHEVDNGISVDFEDISDDSSEIESTEETDNYDLQIEDNDDNQDSDYTDIEENDPETINEELLPDDDNEYFDPQPEEESSDPDFEDNWYRDALQDDEATSDNDNSDYDVTINENNEEEEEDNSNDAFKFDSFDSEEQEPEQESIRLEDAIQINMSKNLKKAFTLNDRFRYRRELFANSDVQMTNALNLVETMASFAEAEDYFYNDMEWDKESPEVIDFMEIIKKHFA